jgi:alkylation response protein AidB-like acyl-CoA dehydrogenase
MAVLNGGESVYCFSGIRDSGTYELALKYSQDVLGKEIFKHQAIAFKLADMATQIMAAKMLCLKAA